LAQAPAPGGIPGGGRGGFAPVQIGPPAPVPAEVAIPRPTPAELEQSNAALKRLIDSDKSPAQPLLKKFESLMLLQPPRLNTAATYTQTQQQLDDQQHVFYMDIGSQFLDDKGVFLPDSFRPDNLHPQAKGYDIWGQAVSAKLAQLLK